MRFYAFGNMYLSSIQQGIQAAHVVGEMFINFPETEWTATGEPDHYLYTWAVNHKTMILLNGGYGSNLHDLYEFFNQKGKNPYPYAKFHESGEALDGALTSVGIVLPEKIYEGAAMLRKGKDGDTIDFDKYTAWEIQLMERLTTFGMAK